MVEDRIGYRYAKSAFSLALEHQELEAVRDDMSMIHDLCHDSREFSNMLVSPIISGKKKLEVLELIFDGKFRTTMVPLLVQMIVQKGRESFLPNVTEAFLGMYDEAKGILRGVLTSASELSAATVEDVKAAMEKSTGKSFEMTTEVDPDLIGGFKLTVGDRLFDGSLSSSLRKLKQELA